MAGSNPSSPSLSKSDARSEVWPVLRKREIRSPFQLIRAMLPIVGVAPGAERNSIEFHDRVFRRRERCTCCTILSIRRRIRSLARHRGFPQSRTAPGWSVLAKGACSTGRRVGRGKIGIPLMPSSCPPAPQPSPFPVSPLLSRRCGDIPSRLRQTPLPPS